MRLRVIADISFNIKMNEHLAKIGFSCVRSSVIVIRSAYFGAQKAKMRKKNVGVNRSASLFAKVPTLTCFLACTLYPPLKQLITSYCFS